MNDKATDAKLENATEIPRVPTGHNETVELARWKLALLMFGNSLAVFCVALVW